MNELQCWFDLACYCVIGDVRANGSYDFHVWLVKTFDTIMSFLFDVEMIVRLEWRKQMPGNSAPTKRPICIVNPELAL